MHRVYWVLLGIEGTLICASIGAAVVLFTHPVYFAQHNPIVWNWIRNSPLAHEWEWGMLAAFAAGAKLSGLVFLNLRGARKDLLELAYFLRQFGWLLSALFWGGVCLSYSIGDFWSLGATALRTVAFLSVAVMAMGPVMPEVIDESEPSS